MNNPNTIPNQRLFTAAALGDIAMAQEALNLGANINIRNPFFNRTPLMIAVSRINFDMVRFLVENGANVLLRDVDGDNAEEITLRIFHNEDEVQLIEQIRNYLHTVIHWSNLEREARIEGAPENQIEYILSESGEQRTRANKKRLNEVIKKTNKRLRGLEFGKKKVRLNLNELKRDLKKVS
jgi:ankyrin repeat protein